MCDPGFRSPVRPCGAMAERADQRRPVGERRCSSPALNRSAQRLVANEAARAGAQQHEVEQALAIFSMTYEPSPGARRQLGNFGPRYLLNSRRAAPGRKRPDLIYCGVG